MKQRMLLILIFSIITTLIFAQTINDTSSKIEQFSSKTGILMKFIDYDLEFLLLTSGTAKCKIRKIIIANEKEFFLQISKVGVNETKTASIAYKDLIEVIKALKTLKLESSTDLTLNPDHLENKFITDDGFQIGYYIIENEIHWYLTLEKYGSNNNTVFLRDVEHIEILLNSAKSKIEELM
jgi:hypothetical protein